MSSTIRLPEPTPAQWEILRCPARFVVAACGRRFGKTEAGKILSVSSAARGATVWWISPSYAISEDTWNAFKVALAEVTAERDERLQTVRLHGGGVIVVRSGHDPDLLRGAGLDLVVLDEAALLPSELWFHVIRPALADKRGRAVFLSTPRGSGTWFHQLYQLGADPLVRDWHSFSFPTAAGGLVTPEEIEELRATLPPVIFQEEIEAQFVSSSGEVFRRVNEVCVGQAEDGPRDGERYLVGVDWGRTADASVFAVFALGERRLVHLDRFTDTAWDAQYGRLQALAERWHPLSITAESNAIGGPAVEQLVKLGLPVKPFLTSNSSKAELVETLSLAMERGSVILLDHPVLRGELLNFGQERLPSGVWRYAARGNGHDDCLVAVCLAVWAAEQYAHRQPRIRQLQTRGLSRSLDLQRDLRSRSRRVRRRAEAAQKDGPPTHW